MLVARQRLISLTNYAVWTVSKWHGNGLSYGSVTIRKRLARTATGTLILLAALISVGLTAPADGPFTIEVKPVFLRLDAEALADSRASALGLDIDIKIGEVHLHFAWSAVPMATLIPGDCRPATADCRPIPSSTKDPKGLL